MYEGDPRSNANLCVISFTIAILQDGLHQNYDALSNFPDPITILTESHSNPCCLATRECKVNDLGHGHNGFYLCNEVSYAKHNYANNRFIPKYINPFNKITVHTLMSLT